MIHTSQFVLYGAAIAGVLVVILGAAAWYAWRQYTAGIEQRVDELVENEDGPIQFKPPEVRRSVFDVLRVTRHYQRGQRLAKKGYVKWYKLGSTISRPKWVKPRQQGAGTPKVTEDGQPYYFPKEAMVADELTGAYVAVHREGEADPINLRDPAYPGIEADLMERIINLEAEDKPPGWLDNLAFDEQTLLYGGIAVLFVIYAAYQYMG